MILGVYSHKLIDGHESVNHFGGLHPRKKLTDMDPSSILQVYTPTIINGHGSVNYLGGLHAPKN